MGDAQLKPMDVAAFLDWEERQELRHEFDGIETFAMTGGPDAHSAIQAGLMRALGNHLDGTPCQPRGSELKIRTATSVRYPDAFVVCSPRVPAATVVTDPVVIFEILSKSTEAEDLAVKNAEYQSIPSVQRYIVLRQTHRSAIVYERKADFWSVSFKSGADAVLDMPEIGISIALAEIYKNITLAGDRLG